MKMIICMTLFMASLTSAFAGQVDPIPEPQAGLIRRAIQDELAKNYLQCTTYGIYSSTAKVIKNTVKLISKPEVVIYLQRDHSQPVLSFQFKNDSVKVTLDVTTTEDLKTLTQLNIVRELITTTNVGTVVDPVYEHRIRAKDLDLTCVAQSKQN